MKAQVAERLAKLELEAEVLRRTLKALEKADELFRLVEEQKKQK